MDMRFPDRDWLLALAVGVTLALGGLAPVAAQQDTVVFGGAASYTGKYAESGKRLEQGYRLWESEINAKGGLLGKKVRFIILDDKSDPKTSIKLYEKLITEDKVDLVLAPYSSEITEAVASTTEKYKHPMVAAGAATTEIWERGRKYIFGLVTASRFYLEGALDIAAKKGYKRVAIIGEDSLFPRASAKGGADMARQRGMEVVLNEFYPKATTDFAALLIKVKALKAEVLLANTYLPDSVAITRQMNELDVNVKVFVATVGPGLPDFSKNLGPLAEYVLGPTQWEPVDLGFPGAKEFVQRFKAKFGDEPNYHNAGGYASMVILEKAIRKAGAFDREAIRRALIDLEDLNFYGEFKLDPHTGLQIGHKMLTFQILKGERRIVWPEKYREVEPVVPFPEWKSR